jgi:hypothetical protein
MIQATINLYLPEPGDNAQVTFDINGELPTMDLINALDALMKSLCLEVVGPEREDGPALAERMKNHILVGRYEMLRSYVVATEQPKITPQQA